MATDSEAVREFRLPDLGEGLTEGEIAAWLVDVGDSVAVDQPVAEVETAKAVVEVPSPYAGVVVVRHAEVGQEVAVGEPLISVDTEGRRDAGADDADGSSSTGDQRDAEHREGADDAASGNVLVGYGTATAAGSRRRRGGGPGSAHATGTAAHGRPLAKPPVRKMAKDLGVDLTTVTPTGDGGVITRDDVRAAAEPSAEEPGEQRIPLSAVRRAIAQKMTRAHGEIPDATTWVDCDATALMAVRDELNAMQSDVHVSPLALILRACVAGLRRHRHLNARFDAESSEIVVLDRISLGFAAQTDRGLLVPVITDADKKSTLQLAAELNDLAEQARAGTLPPAQMAGSTFSVSNYGSFGVDGGAPVINHPETAILGVGRISPRPWVINGALAVRDVVQLSLAFDHRVCDGYEAAGFLRFVADCVERPSRLLADV